MHLFKLKLAAAMSRQESVKGEKDIRDLIKVIRLIKKQELSHEISVMITNEELNFLKNTLIFEVFKNYFMGNVAKASVLKKECDDFMVGLEKRSPKWKSP